MLLVDCGCPLPSISLEAYLDPAYTANEVDRGESCLLSSPIGMLYLLTRQEEDRIPVGAAHVSQSLSWPYQIKVIAMDISIVLERKRALRGKC